MEREFWDFLAPIAAVVLMSYGLNGIAKGVGYETSVHHFSSAIAGATILYLALHLLKEGDL